MQFTYYRITARDDDEEYGEEFYYEPSEEELQEALADIIKSLYFADLTRKDSLQDKLIRQGIKRFIDSEDELWDRLAKAYYSELKDYFKSDAQKSYSKA